MSDLTEAVAERPVRRSGDKSYCLMKVECLDYRRIPQQNKLFLDYLYHFDRVSSLYNSAHLGLDQLKQRAESVLKDPPQYPRQQLTRQLLNFNRTVGASRAVTENIAKLKSPRTLAVVTGHQLGLLGGPALSVYKAATAVRLAQLLGEEGYPTVPVFWLASDDSDFQEIRNTCFFDAEGSLLQLSYPGLQLAKEQMVGTIPLESIGGCLERLEKEGAKGDYRDLLSRIFSRSYRPQDSFRLGWARWLSSLFRDFGLILFDPLLTGYKVGLCSAFQLAIEKRQALIQELQVRGDFLQENGFDPQVQVSESETFLFLVEGEKRFKFRYQEGFFRANNRHLIRFSREQLCEQVRQAPESLAPNVLLRPIVQDHLFPTVVYVGGPSEVAYFSQVSSISPFWNREVAIFPRVSVTLVDRKAQRLLKKYDLSVAEVWKSKPSDVTRKILARVGTRKVLEDFDNLHRTLDKRLLTLRREIEKADPPVAEMLERAKRKIFYQVDKVQNRFVSNHRNFSSDFDRHLDYLYSHLYPQGKLQERVINFNQFLLEEGLQLVDQIVQEIRPFCKAHQVVYV